MQNIDEKIHKISLRLKAFAAFTGMQIVWKRIDGLAEEGVLREQALHCTAFCKAVKSTAAMGERCRVDENVVAVNEVLRLKEPYIKTCHAGISEWVLPLFVEARLAGLLYVGPFRLEGAECGYPRFEAEFADFKVLGVERCNELLSLAQLLAGAVLEYYAPLPGNRWPQKADIRIIKALEWMKQHVSNRFTAAQVAEVCHLSVSRFVHLFNEQTGKSFSEYRLDIRVERAKQLLKTTGIGMDAVAAESGFSSQNHFASVFRKYMATNPLRYRREHLNRNIV